MKQFIYWVDGMKSITESCFFSEMSHLEMVGMEFANVSLKQNARIKLKNVMNKTEICLVEDTSDFRKIVRAIFSKFLPEYNLRSFQGADEIYKYMILQSSDDYDGRRPSLIILDLKLPNINGIELLKLLRQTPANRVTDWKTIPVVMLSSTDRQEDINKCYQAGASSYLVKPMNFDDLRKLLETICFYWIDLNKVTGKVPEVVSGATQMNF